MVHSDVSLVLIESRSSQSILDALFRNFDAFHCRNIVLFSSIRPGCDLPVCFIEIEEFSSLVEYSNFVFRRLHSHVSSSYIIVGQWDGFILNPELWDDDWLSYDYIGAPWPQFEPPYNVGNGGFSLRSRRLLEALKDPDVVVGIRRMSRSAVRTGRSWNHDTASGSRRRRSRRVFPTSGASGLARRSVFTACSTSPICFPAMWANGLTRLTTSCCTTGMRANSAFGCSSQPIPDISRSDAGFSGD